MELGALVCTARAPRCGSCPVVDGCAWHRAGRPTYDGPAARPQAFAGTDRQVRGLLLDVLRAAQGPVGRPALDAVWSEPVQRERALASLVTDGLVQTRPDGRYALPS
jgi:A/G-specific adenine glycosylase